MTPTELKARKMRIKADLIKTQASLLDMEVGEVRELKMIGADAAMSMRSRLYRMRKSHGIELTTELDGNTLKVKRI